MAERHVSLEDHVTCSICMDLYRDPLALPCMHSFCKRCVQGIFASAMTLKMLFEDRLKELEKQQKVVRSNWKFCRDLTEKTQLEAKNKKDELSAYFKRLKAILERRETDLKLELETRENKAMNDCKRQTDLLQASEKRLNSAIGQIRQLLTEERLQMLNIISSQYEREIMSVTDNNESEIKPSTMPSPFENMSLVTCQFEKEVRDIKWEWPKQVYEPFQTVMPTAPPSESTSMQPILLPRRQSSQKEKQYSQSRTNQQYYMQQHNQQNGQQQQQQQEARQPSLQTGSLVQRGKHWKSAMEDGGPGHFGTVTQTMLDPHVYMVIWPNGKSGSYTYNPPWKEEVIPP